MRLNSNMTVYEIMQSHCVMVNGGSGVLVNAMTLDYTYVLTAYHVIRDTLDNIEVTDHNGNKLKVLAVLLYPDIKKVNESHYDFAILKIEYQPEVTQSCFTASTLPPRAELALVGFPNTERRSSDPIKYYDGHMTSVVDELVIFTIDGVPGLATIKGMSGGGVYHIVGRNTFLVGVEFRMDGTEEEQQFGRVQCHSLAKFDEIIRAYNSAPMIPAHLECFSRIQDKIFKFNVIDQNNVRNLKDALETLSASLIASGMSPPYKIMGQYGLQLLMDPKTPNELSNKELWISYFEFLVICSVIDNVGIVDDAYLKSLERKRRLLYTSDGANWISRLEELLKTARKLLDKDGTLIVASPDAAASVLPPNFRLKNVISNIAVVPNQGPFAIDEVESSIYTSFKLTHLEGLRKSCVIDSEDEYLVVPAGVPQLQLFKEKLNEIIK